MATSKHKIMGNYFIHLFDTIHTWYGTILYKNAFKLKMWYINYYTDSFYTFLYMEFLLVNVVN